jgi:hypothetical protein
MAARSFCRLDSAGQFAHTSRRVILVQNNFIFALTAIAPRLPVSFERGADVPDRATAVAFHGVNCILWRLAVFIN